MADNHPLGHHSTDHERSGGGGSDKGIHKIIPSKGDTPAKRRQKVIVLGTIILVVLTLFVVMGRGGSSSSADSADSSGGDLGNDASGFEPSASSGGSGDYGAQLAGEIGSIPNQVASALNQQNLNRLVRARTNLAGQRRKTKRARTKVRKEHKTIVHQRREIRTLRHHHPVHHKGKKAG